MKKIENLEKNNKCKKLEKFIHDCLPFCDNVTLYFFFKRY